MDTGNEKYKTRPLTELELEEWKSKNKKNYQTFPVTENELEEWKSRPKKKYISRLGESVRNLTPEELDEWKSKCALAPKNVLRPPRPPEPPAPICKRCRGTGYYFSGCDHNDGICWDCKGASYRTYVEAKKKAREAKKTS